MAKIKNASDLLTHLFEDYVLFQGKSAAIPFLWNPASPPGSNLVLLTGDNASGKSVARRILCSLCRDADPPIEPMQGRAGGGMASAFVYGSEDWESTGQISARTITGGIRTCEGREKPHMIFWDEPDLGLSDSWAAGVGVAIAEFARHPPKLTRGIFVVTHSKALVSQILNVPHHFVHFGDGEHPVDLAAWSKAPIEPRPIEELGERSHQRFQRIQEVINKNKAEGKERGKAK